MERRDFCLEFIKGHCLDKINCKYAHVIVPDKQGYLSKIESKEIDCKLIEKYGDQVFQIYQPSKDKKKWLTKCKCCEKGFTFDFEIERGSKQSLYCPVCIDKVEEDIENL
jgi:hypothetical protein